MVESTSLQRWVACELVCAREGGKVRGGRQDIRRGVKPSGTDEFESGSSAGSPVRT